MTIALSILFMALQIADWWTTRRFLAAGVEEANPVMRSIIRRFGLAGLLVAKLCIGAAVVAIFWNVPIVLALACAFYVGVIIWNYKRGSN